MEIYRPAALNGFSGATPSKRANRFPVHAMVPAVQILKIQISAPALYERQARLSEFSEANLFRVQLTLSEGTA